jgi:hypothetical protein
MDCFVANWAESCPYRPKYCIMDETSNTYHHGLMEVTLYLFWGKEKIVLNAAACFPPHTNITPALLILLTSLHILLPSRCSIIVWDVQLNM